MLLCIMVIIQVLMLYRYTKENVQVYRYTIVNVLYCCTHVLAL